MTENVSPKTLIPSALITRRLHSITGLWLTIYLMQHLFINSQAVYFLGDSGKGFVHAVNSIHELPYLPIIELLILGLPILIHMIWGAIYLFSAKYNAYSTDGTKPSLPNYGRNRAYTWQRITSYLLVFGIIAHVVHMRFIEYPGFASVNNQPYYMVLVNLDDGIYTVASRLDVELYDHQNLKIAKDKNEDRVFSEINLDPKIEEMLEKQKLIQEENFIETLKKYHLKKNQAIAVAKDFGTADLLMLRETFKMPIMIALYTVFVLAACYHGFNGLWTFLISWGVTLTARSRNLFLKISYGLMLIFSFLGLSVIYATYWINLKN